MDGLGGSIMPPAISVIMLTYNREKLVGRAVESILSQTFTDFEFIIVDNGSTDSGGAICDGYAAKDSRLTVIHRERGNIGSGRNTGLDNAKGGYVAFIDDDDYALPDFLEFLLNTARTHDADIAVCGSYKEENGRRLPNIIYDELYIMDAVKATEAYLRRRLYNAAMPTKLFKRELFNNIRFSNFGSYDDIITAYRYFVHAPLTVAHGVPKYCFYRHSGNNSRASTSDNLINPLQLREYLAAFYERTGYIRSKLPEMGDFALYSEWSYMISMCNKIITNKLENCAEPLNFMRGELAKHYDEFYYGPYIEGFEKDWMDKYIVE